MASSRGDAGAVAQICQQLETLALDGASDLTHVAEDIRQLLGTEIVCIYGLDEAPVGFELARLHAPGMPARFRTVFAEFLTSAPRRWGAYDAARPEPSQRNRVVEPTRLVDMRALHVNQRVFAPIGLGNHGHLRTLVCDGASLLAWFGALSSAPYTHRQRRLLRALTRPMHARLLAERRLQRGRLGAAALDVLLAELPSPAMIVDARGTVRESNAAGRALLARSRQEVRIAITDALAGRPSSMRVTKLHDKGTAAHWLAIAPVDSAQARVAAAAHRWSLTPRETEVFGWIARGATNQRIAAELGCSEHTVELHVTHILTKADVGSRTALVAALLSST